MPFLQSTEKMFLFLLFSFHELITKERIYPLRRISYDALNNVKLRFYFIKPLKKTRTKPVFKVLKWLPGLSVLWKDKVAVT